MRYKYVKFLLWLKQVLSGISARFLMVAWELDKKAKLASGQRDERGVKRLWSLIDLRPPQDCPNCDGVGCMHMVMRDWWSPDIDECDGWCCPTCRPSEDDILLASLRRRHGAAS